MKRDCIDEEDQMLDTDHFLENLWQNSLSSSLSNLAKKLTLLTSQKPSAGWGSSLYLKQVWMGIDPAFPERWFRLSLATRWQSLWKQTSFSVSIQKHRTFRPCFLAKSMKYRRSSFLGLVLSITTDLPCRMFSSATLQHFSFVFRVSRFTRIYPGRKFLQKVDLPEPGAPTISTISLGWKSTLLPFPKISSPSSGTVVGLNPFTSILSFSPKNKFSGVLNSIPTLRPNLRSESEKSLCFASLRPAASPQQKLVFLSTSTFPLYLLMNSCHMPRPGFLNQSSEVATKTCISTPMALAMLPTLILMCSGLVFPFSTPSWLVKMMILKPSSANFLMAGLTLSLRKIQSSASLGNLAPLLRVTMVSSRSKDAILAESLRAGEHPTRQLPSVFQFQPLSLFSLAIRFNY